MRTLLLFWVAACGCSQPECVIPTQSSSYRIDAITLPQRLEDFAYDLNGDQHADDKLAEVVRLFSDLKVDMQRAVSVALQAHDLSGYLTVFKDAGRFAGVQLELAGLRGPTLCSDRSYDSYVTRDATPSELQVPLPYPGGDTVPLQLVRMNVVADESYFEAVVTGAIRIADVRTRLVSDLGLALQANISSAVRVSQYFDVGGSGGLGCVNPDQTMALPGDGVIGDCEVRGPSFVRDALNPDVQLYGDDGSWHPNRANQYPDSMSVGFGISGTPVQP